MKRESLVKYLIDSEFTERELNSILRKFELDSIQKGAQNQHDLEVKFRKMLSSKRIKFKNKFYGDVLSYIGDQIYLKKQELKEAKRKADRNEKRRNKGK